MVAGSRNSPSLWARRSAQRAGVLFERGDTATAVLASNAVPDLFQPMRITGRECGGESLVMPVPLRQARQLGAETVIALDTLPAA